MVGDALARMVAEAGELGGTVVSIAGDGLLTLFGAPVAHEDDPERAIRAGLRITEERPTTRRRWSGPGGTESRCGSA